MNKYRVTTRDTWSHPAWIKGIPWAKEIPYPADRFGEINSIHELSDDEVITAIMIYGRAEITQDEIDPNLRILCFQNDYD